jgi:hypothetical protein
MTGGRSHGGFVGGGAAVLVGYGMGKRTSVLGGVWSSMGKGI